jgi:FixJ family two-component response regulator
MVVFIAEPKKMLPILSKEVHSFAPPPSAVYIVDEDDLLRERLKCLLSGPAREVHTFRNPADFLSLFALADASCVILETDLEGMSGLELQSILLARKDPASVIFYSRRADVSTAVLAMKRGAADFITKPCIHRQLLDAVTQAFATGELRRVNNQAIRRALLNYSSLTHRERQVLELVTSGMMNKQVATELGLSEITVKIHRRRVMLKMAVSTLPGLVRLVDALRAVSPESTVYTQTHAMA